jgi:hypothetical protein
MTMTTKNSLQKSNFGRRLSEMPHTIKKLPSYATTQHMTIRNFEPLEVAQQLCLIEYEIFSVLKASTQPVLSLSNFY